MCEKADENAWSRVLSDAEPRGEWNRRASADTITPTASSETQSTVEGSVDTPKQMPAHSEQVHAGVSTTIYTAQGKLTPERLTDEAKEQSRDLTDHTKEKSQEAMPETIKAAEDAVYKPTTEKAENIMQNVDETINHDVDRKINQVTEPAFGRAAETSSLASQPIPTATSSAALPPPPPTMATATSSRETDSSIMDTVMQNPLPAALIGLGLSWLLMNMYQSRKPSVTHKTGQADRHTGGQMSSTQNGSSHGQPIAAVSQVQSVPDDMSERLQETASSVASQIQNQVSDIADRTRDGVSNLASRVEQGVRRIGHQYQQSLQENPLAVGAAALALGSAIGLALPTTGAENKLMGKAHENLMRKVDEATHGTVQKVREVAGEAGRAARREAEYQGLTG